MPERLLPRLNGQLPLTQNEPTDRRADLARWASLAETRDDEIAYGLARFRDVLETRWHCGFDEAEFLGFLLNWKRLPARRVAAVVLDEVSGKVKAFRASDFVTSEEVFVMTLTCGMSVLVNLAIPDRVPPGSFRRLGDFVFQQLLWGVAYLFSQPAMMDALRRKMKRPAHPALEGADEPALEIREMLALPAPGQTGNSD